MSMTFDEEINKYKGLSYQSYGLFPIYTNEDIYKLIEELKKEYAPTVEMTQEQHDYIAPLIQEGKELGATFTEFWEVYKYMGASKKLTPAFKNQEQAMQSWLHPDLIETIDN